MSITNISCTDDREKPLESPAKKRDRSKPYSTNQPVREFLSRQTLEESRWKDTLTALESIKTVQAIDEIEVNAWLNGWSTGTRIPTPNWPVSFKRR